MFINHILKWILVSDEDDCYRRNVKKKRKKDKTLKGNKKTVVLLNWFGKNDFVYTYKKNSIFIFKSRKNFDLTFLSI